MGDTHKFRQTIYESLLDLITPDGINASGRDEAYGCIFGRDSAITILKILNFLKRESASNLYNKDHLTKVIKTSLLTLVSLQGRETNIESGEQPGKFIHEYRKDKYEMLVNRDNPWYIYPDKKLRNYDSIDSTPINLIAIYRFWEQTGDDKFLLEVLPNVEKGLNWIYSYGDMDKDDLLEYELSPKRRYGGLPVQSWTDSRDCLILPDGTFPLYPIAPVEVQGYAWLSLKLWAGFYSKQSPDFGRKLLLKAKAIKKKFNKKFIFKDEGFYFAAQALDGNKNMIKTITGNPLLLLWATYVGKNGEREAIIEKKYIKDLVERSFQSDMFEEDAGIRTMSTKSQTFNPKTSSYHNGSFWPKLNGMAYEGLLNWDFKKEAEKLKEATLKPIVYFGSPIELYIKDGEKYLNYRSEFGKEGCKYQAWTAATVLDLLT